MQHARDFDALVRDKEIDEIILHAVAPKTGREVVPQTASVGRLGQPVALDAQRLREPFGGKEIMLRDVSPDFGQVRLGQFSNERCLQTN